MALTLKRAPKSPPEYIGAAEAARLLGFEHDDARKLALMLLRRRDALELAGFPPPVPWRQTPLAWRRADVVAWLDGQLARGAAPSTLPAPIFHSAANDNDRAALHWKARTP